MSERPQATPETDAENNSRTDQPIEAQQEGLAHRISQIPPGKEVVTREDDPEIMADFFQKLVDAGVLMVTDSPNRFIKGTEKEDKE